MKKAFENVLFSVWGLIAPTKNPGRIQKGGRYV
jgi:hypothetical protein